MSDQVTPEDRRLGAADAGAEAVPDTPAVDAPVGPPPWPPEPRTGTGAPGSRPWARFVAGVVVGALVGGATAGGVYLATQDNASNRTVVLERRAPATSHSTSVIAQPQDVQAIIQKVEPAVVAIRTGAAVDSGLFSPGGGLTGGAGTGFVISPDGVIVTNDHVVEGSGGRIEVTFSDGRSKPASALGMSPDNDLAVLKVDGSNLPTVKLGSSEKLAVGDDVIAIGNALALEGGLSVTRGIISAKGRTVPEDNGTVLVNMLQTDAAINEGNSGGPLVNAAGEVVGINTAIAGGSQNIGFAIAMDTAKPVIDDLRQGKSVRTGFLGVETTDVTPAIVNQLKLTTQSGALVVRVTAGSGAAKAGVRANDVIISVDGKKVSRADDLGALVRQHRPGDHVQLTIERAGTDQKLDVTLGERPQSAG